MGSLDHALFLFFNKTLNMPWLDPFMVVLTNSTFLATLFASLLFLYLVKAKDKKTALLFIVFALVTYALADAIPHRVLKPFFGRLRPCNPTYFINGVHQFLPGGHFLIGFKSSYSMPSIHSLTAFALAIYWGMLFPKIRGGILLFAALVAYTRVYVGVHYPTDLLVGALLGVALGYGVYRLVLLVEQKLYGRSEEK